LAQQTKTFQGCDLLQIAALFVLLASREVGKITHHRDRSLPARESAVTHPTRISAELPASFQQVHVSFTLPTIASSALSRTSQSIDGDL
jgi:hypothetical protein